VRLLRRCVPARQVTMPCPETPDYDVGYSTVGMGTNFYKAQRRFFHTDVHEQVLAPLKSSFYSFVKKKRKNQRSQNQPSHGQTPVKIISNHFWWVTRGQDGTLRHRLSVPSSSTPYHAPYSIPRAILRVAMILYRYPPRGAPVVVCSEPLTLNPQRDTTCHSP
jgi:hypothetical protein